MQRHVFISSSRHSDGMVYVLKPPGHRLVAQKDHAATFTSGWTRLLP